MASELPRDRLTRTMRADTGSTPDVAFATPGCDAVTVARHDGPSIRDHRQLSLCVVSFKECWQDADGRWLTDGGFPAQIQSLATLFETVTIVIVGVQPRPGGMHLPAHARVIALRRPVGEGVRRKISVVGQLRYYFSTIARSVRQADVVHTPVPGDLPLLGMVAALMLRKRLFGLYNGSWEPNTQTTAMNRVTQAVMTRTARRGVMLAVGDGERPPAAGMEWIFASSLSQCEVQRIRPALDRGLSEPPKLVYAGRLSEEKGVDYLIRALARLKAQGHRPLPTVALAGDGPKRTELEALAKQLACDDVVTFHGQLEREPLSRLLGESDVCVHPALTEGFCKAWLDAMVHGLPVLGSDVGAARAVIGARGQRGWLVPAGDVESLAAMMRRVSSDTVDWPTLRSNCRAYAEQRTLEAWAEQIGHACRRHWKLSLREGKLCLPLS